MSDAVMEPTQQPTGSPVSEFNTITFAEETPETPAASPETPVEAPAVVEKVISAPEPVAAPEPPSDFSVNTLENGDKEVRLASGEVFRGKTDAELIQKMALGKLEATRTIQNMRQRPAEVIPPQQPQTVDATSQAMLDLMAPGLGLQNGQELAQMLQQQQAVIQEMRNNQTAVQFFQAVPDFPKVQENTEKLGAFLDERGLPFTVDNALLAHYYLKGSGQYVSVPEPAARTPTGQFAAKANIMPPPPNGNPAPPTGIFTDADILAMSPQEYAKNFGY